MMYSLSSTRLRKSRPRCSASASVSTIRVAQELHDGRDHEDHGAEDSGGRVLRARRHALQLRDGLLEQQHERREAASRNARSARTSSASAPTDTMRTPAEAARDSAARMDQKRDRREVGAELQDRSAPLAPGRRRRSSTSSAQPTPSMPSSATRASSGSVSPTIRGSSTR